MAQRGNDREDEEYRRVAARYSVSYMSDARWLRLFAAVHGAEIRIERAEWRYLGSPHASWKPFPEPTDLLPNRFADGKFQPVRYRWIESVFIPKEYAPVEGVGYCRQQDIAGLVRAITEAGQFELEESEDGLTILAYRV